MPTCCCICGKYARKQRFHSISASQYEAALKIHNRVASRANRPPHACPGCYNAIVAATNKDEKIVMLPSVMGREAGLGVFVHQETLEPGEYVTDYTGLVVLKERAHEMPTISHMRKLLSDTVIDGRSARVKNGGGLGSMINRPPKGARPNVKMVDYVDRRTKITSVRVRVPLQSAGGRAIAPGTELMHSYGKKYALPESKVRKSRAGRPQRRLPPSHLSFAYKVLSQTKRQK